MKQEVYNLWIGVKKSLVRALPIVVLFNAAALINWLPASLTEMTVGSLLVLGITFVQNYLKFKYPQYFNVAS